MAIQDIQELLTKTAPLRAGKSQQRAVDKIYRNKAHFNIDLHMNFSVVNQQHYALWVDRNAGDGCFELLARSLPVWGWYREEEDALWCYYNPSLWRRTSMGPVLDTAELTKQLDLGNAMAAIAADDAQLAKWPEPLSSIIRDWGFIAQTYRFGEVMNLHEISHGLYPTSDGMVVSGQFSRDVPAEAPTLVKCNAVDSGGISFERLRARTRSVDWDSYPVKKFCATGTLLTKPMLERFIGWVQKLPLEAREDIVLCAPSDGSEEGRKPSQQAKYVRAYRAQTTRLGEMEEQGYIASYSSSDNSTLQLDYIVSGKNTYIAAPDVVQDMYNDLAKEIKKSPKWQTAVSAVDGITIGDEFNPSVYKVVAQVLNSIELRVKTPEYLGGEVYNTGIRGSGDYLTAKIFSHHPQVETPAADKELRTDLFGGYVCNLARFAEAKAAKAGRLDAVVDKVSVSSKRYTYRFDPIALTKPYKRLYGKVYFHHHLWRNGNLCNYLLQDLITAGHIDKDSKWWKDLVCFGALTVCLTKALSLPNSRITHRYLFDNSVFKHYLTSADTKVFTAWRNDIRDDNGGKLQNYTEDPRNPNHVINDWMPTSGTKELINFGERVMQVVDASKPLESKKNVPTNTTRAIARMVDPNNPDSLIMTVESIAKNRFTAKARAQFVRMAYPWYTKTVSQYAKSLGFNKTAPSQENRLHPNYKYAGLPIDQSTKAALRGVLPPHSDYEAFLTQSYKNFQKYKPECPKPGDPNPVN